MTTPRIQSSEGLSEKAESLTLRRDIVEALYACEGGHYGGALSVLDIILTLYRRILRISPDEPNHPQRDRFILSKGHACIALYAVLRQLGFFTNSLSSYGQADAGLEGHPDMTVLPGVDFSTGSLGQGLAVGLGMALALRDTDAHTWVVLGDGECQEGQVWEAAMLAARYQVGNLHAVIDVNNFQEWGWQHSDVASEPVPELAPKWRAFGWNVFEVDGHDHEAMASTFKEVMQVVARPSVVLARTIKGKGFPFIEADPLRFHCTTVTAQEQAQILGTA